LKFTLDKRIVYKRKHLYFSILRHNKDFISFLLLTKT